METRFDLLGRLRAGGARWREAPQRPGGPGPGASKDGGFAFDHLAKALAEGVPRREALRRLGGGLAAAMLASLGLGKIAWGQAGRASGGGCTINQGCLDEAQANFLSRSTFCLTLIEHPPAFAACIAIWRRYYDKAVQSCLGRQSGCGEHEHCSNNVCCPEGSEGCSSAQGGSGSCCSSSRGETCCNGACCDQGQNCSNGKCCPAGQYNSDGICCPTGQKNCGGRCLDTSGDTNNCGGCDIKCREGEICLTGNCFCASGIICNDMCCPKGWTCDENLCSPCPIGQVICEGTCCDQCCDGVVCAPAGAVCCTGQARSCPQGSSCCPGGGCLNDSQNCGSCGTRCTGGKICNVSLGGCVCPDGLRDCNGTCQDPLTSSTCCGPALNNCGRSASFTGVCCHGDCCLTGTTCCPANAVSPVPYCVNLQEDTYNCGSCGTVCPGGCCQAVCAGAGQKICDCYGDHTRAIPANSDCCGAWDCPFPLKCGFEFGECLLG